MWGRSSGCLPPRPPGSSIDLMKDIVCFWLSLSSSLCFASPPSFLPLCWSIRPKWCSFLPYCFVFIYILRGGGVWAKPDGQVLTSRLCLTQLSFSWSGLSYGRWGAAFVRKTMWFLMIWAKRFFLSHQYCWAEWTQTELKSKIQKSLLRSPLRTPPPPWNTDGSRHQLVRAVSLFYFSTIMMQFCCISAGLALRRIKICEQPDMQFLPLKRSRWSLLGNPSRTPNGRTPFGLNYASSPRRSRTEQPPLQSAPLQFLSRSPAGRFCQSPSDPRHIK